MTGDYIKFDLMISDNIKCEQNDCRQNNCRQNDSKQNNCKQNDLYKYHWLLFFIIIAVYSETNVSWPVMSDPNNDTINGKGNSHTA